MTCILKNNIRIFRLQSTETFEEAIVEYADAIPPDYSIVYLRGESTFTENRYAIYLNGQWNIFIVESEYPIIPRINERLIKMIGDFLHGVTTPTFELESK